MINSIYSTALFGLQRNQKAFEFNAEAISRIGTVDSEGSSLPDNIVGLMTAERGMQANLAVLSRTDDMIGSLIDTFA